MMQFLFVFLSFFFVTAARQLDLVFVLVDDWGFANVGYHRDASWPGNNETLTPNIDRLAASGLILDQNYVFKYCSPTRSALQTGRNPIHVNVLNSDIFQHNDADPEAGFQGAALAFTGIAEKLKSVGYMTAQAGKWNAGMAHESQTPSGRGYDSSLFYFDYDTWFYNGTMYDQKKCDGGPMTDLSTSVAGSRTMPGVGLNNTWACSQNNQSPVACPHGYQDDAFIERIEEVIQNSTQSPDKPLFIFWGHHAPHDPYEVPAKYWDKFPWIDIDTRRYYSGMVNYLDDNFGRLEQSLRSAGRWDNTLVIVSSDNGGPADWGIRAGNNFPLRGKKSTNWQGGVRVNSFAFGGALDPALAGTSTSQFTAIEDWWTTFSLIGGANATDERAVAAGLPGVDGLDLRGLFLAGGNRTSPRNYVILGDSKGGMSVGNTTVGGVIRRDGWKLLVGDIGDAAFQGPIWPNKTATPSVKIDCSNGCLYNIFTDPRELVNVAASNPTIVAELRAVIEKEKETVWSPNRGTDDGLACKVALEQRQGFVGPFL
jgi:arylsulfatase B